MEKNLGHYRLTADDDVAKIGMTLALPSLTLT